MTFRFMGQGSSPEPNEQAEDATAPRARGCFKVSWRVQPESGLGHVLFPDGNVAWSQAVMFSRDGQ